MTSSDQLIIAISSATSAIATVVIAIYAVMSHQLSAASKRLAEQIAKRSGEADERHLTTLEHLTAATLATGPWGRETKECTAVYQTHLKNVQESLRNIDKK